MANISLVVFSPLIDIIVCFSAPFVLSDLAAARSIASKHCLSHRLLFHCIVTKRWHCLRRCDNLLQFSSTIFFILNITTMTSLHKNFGWLFFFCFFFLSIFSFPPFYWKFWSNLAHKSLVLPVLTFRAILPTVHSPNNVFCSLTCSKVIFFSYQSSGKNWVADFKHYFLPSTPNSTRQSLSLVAIK